MQASISLDTGNTLSVLAALADPQNAQRVANAAAESYTDDMLDYIQSGRSFTPGEGGGLEQSISWHGLGNGAAEIAVLDRQVRKVDPQTGRVTLSNTKDYAVYVEEGTRPHSIGPKPDRRGVKMNVPGGEGYIVRRSFEHPGSAPHPFFFAEQAAREENMQARALSVLAMAMNHAR